ncbi:FG-GAP-like repeat-containing protein [Stieleria sp. TO1_6]|uniref:CRTAC1 family protein n=1 Tax=Stieleria tagensis TaxID=2956795 RepID=UPI00209A7407|nr:FG-GAP-like repeat-containing protein [Stieleria tagensis]MCO8120854.1 FG-GAP-like repeat-containing protein [Stieleria tagensis]
MTGISAIRYGMLALSVILLTGCGSKKKPPSDAASNGNGTTQTSGGESEAQLLKIKSALAATENLEPQQAAALWSDLAKTFPKDPSVALNQALNAVLRVDQLTATATDAVKTADEKKAARRLLADAIEAARTSVKNYQSLSGDEVTGQWLESRVDAHEATLLGTTISKSLRRDLFARLTTAIQGPLGENPAAIVLGGPLVDLLEKMSDPIDGLPANVQTPAAAALRRLSDQNPDNLFLALRALRLAIDEQDASATQLVQRSWNLAQAVEPTLAAYTKPIGLTPQQLSDQISQAIESADWAKAEQSFVLWSNVLGPLEILRTDRRRTSPHPLDRLNFDTVRRLSAQIAKQNPVPQNTQSLTFDRQEIGSNIRHVLAIDSDLDLDADLISVTTDNQLQLWTRQDDSWKQQASLAMQIAPAGMIAADLFMVDSSDSGRLRKSGESDGDTDGDTDGDRSEYSMKVRHNTLPGLVLYGEFGIQLAQIDTRAETAEDQRLTLLSDKTGLEDLPAVAAVIAGDLEGDGDLDLVAAPKTGPLRTFINRGNRTFFEAVVATSTVAPDDAVVQMAIADLDRDLDLDILTIHASSGRVGILENLLHLQFRFRYLDAVPALPIGAAPEQLFLAVEDVDGNVGWDVIAASDEQTLIAFGNSADIGVWTVDHVDTADGFATRPVLADFDNDSYFELVAADAAVRLGPAGIQPLQDQPTLPLSQDAAAVDFDADGKMDLVSVAEQHIAVGINSIDDKLHQVSVRFKGIADNAAASGRVNHYAIGSVLELRFGPHYRSRIVTSPQTHFGMDGFDVADSIRVIMPNGLTQTIRHPEIDSVVEEEQTLKGSCPYLYSWDGEKFAFVTDCLWAAPLGLQVAAGVVQKDRPWEYLKIDGDLVRPRPDGSYELRMTEELWEVAYVDKIELMAVDHPADVQVFSNEKVGPPNLATPTIFSFAPDDLYAVETANDTVGDDVTERLSHSDEQYVQGFDRRIRQGLCPPHWIDMDFGDAVRDQLATTKNASVYLVLRGWILPTDTSLNIQIDQNPELPAIEFPSVWVPDANSDSGWRNAIPFMGFPGGKTKTIVVDVSDQIDAADPRLRVRTSAQIYWDSASLAIQDQPSPVMTQNVPLREAEVAFHGYSKRSKPHPSAPETYDYQQSELSPKWPPLRGLMTQFGPCTDALKSWDDSMVVISGGDEIRMRFDAPEKAPPAGWKRDFILHCVGWDKDADLNTLTGQSIGPLPIRDMSSYPPTAESAERFESVRRLNEKSLQRRQSFRAFWHPGELN